MTQQLQEFKNMPGVRTMDDLLEEQMNGMQDQPVNPLAILQEALAQMAIFAGNLLSDPNHIMTRMRIDNDLKKMQGYVASVYGGPIPGFAGQAAQFKPEPLTRMFGQDLNRVAPVTRDMLRPDEIERQAFRERRQAMADHLMDQTDDQILDGLKIPGQDLVIRGVAKTFGLDNYQTAPIDVVYLRDLKDLIRDRQTVVTATDVANAAANQLKNQLQEGEGLPDDDEGDDEEQRPLRSMMANMPGRLPTPDQILANAAADDATPPPPPPPPATKKPAPPKGGK